jgi:hypothetical protein
VADYVYFISGIFFFVVQGSFISTRLDYPETATALKWRLKPFQIGILIKMFSHNSCRIFLGLIIKLKFEKPFQY